MALLYHCRSICRSRRGRHHLGGALAGQGIVSVAGSIASILFWPALREARQIHKENMAVRLLEVPLSMAGTAKAAAEALRDAFTTVFLSKNG